MANEFLQGVETGSNLYSRSIDNARTQQAAAQEMVLAPLRVQQVNLQIKQQKAEIANTAIETQQKEYALEDEVTFKDAMARLNQGEMVQPAFKTAAASSMWNKARSESILGKSISDQISNFNEALAKIPFRDRSKILSMKSGPNGIPSPEQYDALGQAEASVIAASREHELSKIKMQNQGRIDLQRERDSAAFVRGLMGGRGASSVTSNASDPDSKAKLAQFEAGMKAINEDFGTGTTDPLTLDQKLQRMQQLRESIYGVQGGGPETPAAAQGSSGASWVYDPTAKKLVSKGGGAPAGAAPMTPISARPQPAPEKPSAPSTPTVIPEDQQVGPKDAAWKDAESWIKGTDGGAEIRKRRFNEALKAEIANVLGIQQEPIGGSDFGWTPANQVTPKVVQFFQQLPPAFRNQVIQKALETAKGKKWYESKDNRVYERLSSKPEDAAKPN